MAGVADDDVVENFHLQQLPGADEVTGDLDVGFRGVGKAARVVMKQNEGAGPGSHRGPEDFTRRNKNGVHRTNGHEVMTPDAAARVKV